MSVEVYKADWSKKEMDLGFGDEDGNWSSDDFKEAGWYECWSNKPDGAPRGGDTEITVYTNDVVGRDGLLVMIDLNWIVGHLMWCAHLGELAVVVSHLEPLANRHLHERVNGDTEPTVEHKILGQVERIANAVWELENDFDAAMRVFLGDPSGGGLVGDIKEGLDGIAMSVDSVAGAVG